jgi:biopolymer transport protein ExbD
MFLKPARNRKYQEIVEVMDIARGAGVQVIGLTPKEAEEAADN